VSTRNLTVRSCNAVHEGTSASGKPWTLYEVAVVGEDGEPITENFKSFENLPIGELVAYEVEREDHPTYGTSYLLKLPKGARRPPKPNLQADVEELRQRIARLESQVGALTGGGETSPAQTSPALASAAVSPALASMGPVPEEDIPF
jgi:hypothetical protein